LLYTGWEILEPLVIATLRLLLHPQRRSRKKVRTGKTAVGAQFVATSLSEAVAGYVRPGVAHTGDIHCRSSATLLGLFD
jgi:hypothetical protein